MARLPLQVLVFPFRRKTDKEFEFAVFKRRDEGYWQAIAGGGEDNETPFETARRESFEEAGITGDSVFYRLDTFSTVPVYHFAARKQWPENLYVIPQYFFAVDITGHEVVISKEHAAFKWETYIKTREILHWETNRIALWELYERLLKNDMSPFE
jgi:dATP pyrophosphohydrolase